MSRALGGCTRRTSTRRSTDRLLPSALLLSAVARAVAEMPAMNGFWVDGGIRSRRTGVHLGVAISLRGGGLIAPALHDADEKTLDEIMAGVRDLVARARSRPAAQLGDVGPDDHGHEPRRARRRLVHGVIYPPQVALVGFGGVRERPWAVDGMLGVRPIVTATLAADHRASDGHAGGRFLTLIDRQLQTPGGAMNEQELREVVIAALTEVAPDVDPAAIDPSAELAEQLDIDSMDFLNIDRRDPRADRHRDPRARLSASSRRSTTRSPTSPRRSGKAPARKRARSELTPCLR